MSAFKVVDRWWSKRAPLLLGGALLVLATMTVMLYIGQLQSNSANKDQANQIASLAKALDDQREAAKEGGAEVVVPPSKEIKEDPSVVKGVKGDTGDTGATGPEGQPGQTGPSGPPGPSGAPGKNGTNGEDGADGSDGANGADGSNGQDGVGVAGPPGPTGPPGPAGRDGVDGQDGQDGEDGKSPTSIRIPVGPVTYVCTPSGPGSTDYTCEPEVGNGNPQASASSYSNQSHGPIPVHPAILLPALGAVRTLRRVRA